MLRIYVKINLVSTSPNYVVFTIYNQNNLTGLQSIKCILYVNKWTSNIKVCYLISFDLQLLTIKADLKKQLFSIYLFFNLNDRLNNRCSDPGKIQTFLSPNNSFKYRSSSHITNIVTGKI